MEQDIREIVGAQSQIDPSFKTERLYTRLSAEEVRGPLVDRLEDLWQTTLRPRFPLVTTRVLNMDNGPENHTRRTQFIKRLVDFVAENQVTVQLAYYPPYHSQYNPIEHCWGALEQHWNGTLLDELDTVLKFAQSMTWREKHPIVSVVTTVYKTGVRLSQAAMADLETQSNAYLLCRSAL